MAHVEKDLKGAEFWLKHLLDEHANDQKKVNANEKWLRNEIAHEAQAAAKVKKAAMLRAAKAVRVRARARRSKGGFDYLRSPEMREKV